MTSLNFFRYLKKSEREKVKFFSEDIYLAKPVPFHSLFRFTTGCEKVTLVLGVALAAVAGVGIPAINLVYGEFTNILIDRQYPGEKTTPRIFLLKYFGGGKLLNANASREERMEALDEDSRAFVVCVAVFAGAALLLLGVSVFIFKHLGIRQVNRMRIKLLRSMLSQSSSWYDVKGHVNLSSKIREDLLNIEAAVGERLPILIYQMSISGIIVALSVYVGWELSLVLIACLLPMTIIYLLLNKIESAITIREIAAVENASHIAEEVFTGIRTVISYTGEEKEITRFAEELKISQALGSIKGIAAGVGFGVVWIIIYLCYAVAFAYGFRLILWSDNYTSAALITVFFSVLTAATCLSYSGPYWEAFATACGSAASIYAIVDKKSEIDPFSNDGLTPPDCYGEIELRDVHFDYPSRPGIFVLNGLNLKINAGERVAIVGTSGSGKSTIFHLIQRLYDPAKGQVYLDGRNIKTLNVSWLRKQMGIVQQEPVLFSMSIGNNISQGAENSSEAEIIEAAKKANIHNFIAELPQGYDTEVGTKFGTLSGGQKQRVTIARVLVRDPKILLLDEITSALDRESESQVRKSLEEAMIGRTVLIITHKLMTLRSMERIVVLQNGIVAEDGTHDSLLKQNGLYASLVKAEQENLNRAMVKMSVARAVNRERGNVEENVKLLPGSRGSYISDFGSASRELMKSVKKKKDDRYLKVGLFEFLSWNKSHWVYLYFGIVVSILMGCVLPCVCILFGELVGYLADINEDTLVQVDVLAVILILIGLLSGLFSFVQMYFLSVASIRLTTLLRLKTFQTIMRQEMAWFDAKKNNVSALCDLINNDCASVPGVIGGRVGVIIQGLTAMLIGIFISLYYSWKLALVTILVVPLIFVGIFLDLCLWNRQRKRETTAVELATKIAVEAIHHVKVVNSLGNERFFLSEYAAHLKTLATRGNLFRSLVRGFAYATGQTSIFFSYAVSLWCGAWLVKEENLHYKQVIRVSELIIYGCWVLGQALVLAPNFGAAKDAASRLQYLFVRRPRIRDGPSSAVPNMSGNNSLDFTNVYFAYPTRPETVVLRNVHISVRNGESVALVGASGSGKSTIIQLLLRYYDPNVGSISIGNVRLQQFKMLNLRQAIGLVSQEPVLFNRSVYENIAYGDNSRNVSLDEVVTAAQAANVHSFIVSLPSGYDTKLGSSLSSHLSGGQKQRIAIARALVRNPKILVLDEATSALDPDSEKSVQETLDRAMSGRTTITIAHRLGAVMRADIIYVLVDGHIVESGTHTELMKAKGHYFRMNQEIV